MTQEEKLLFADVCARLPYGVKMYVGEDLAMTLRQIDYKGFCESWENIDLKCHSRYMLPYLRPLSSITDDELVELRKICPHAVFNSAGAAIGSWILGINGSNYGRIAYIDEMSKILKFCYSHHLDCNGLIEAGLAVEVTEENNPYK